MDLVSIAAADIAALATPVAMHGSLNADPMVADDVFETIVAVVSLIYEVFS
jgi:hypothetical protein